MERPSDGLQATGFTPPTPLLRSSRWEHCASVVLALVLLVQGGCAAGAPPARMHEGSRSHRLMPAFHEARQPRPLAGSTWAATPLEDASAPTEDDDPEDDFDEEPGAPSALVREEGREGPIGWPDGVGDGHPTPVPLNLDYFQGLLEQVGVPHEVLPRNGRSLSPEQAVQLLGHLLDAEVELGGFSRQRMAAHLVLEVATGEGPVQREDLHARMDRFHRLRLVRPDGYLVRVVTGEAVQRAGEVWLAKDGTLRAGGYEVGPFYAVEGGQLWPVDTELEIPRGAKPLGPYVPDGGVVLPALEGAGLALGDMVESLGRLVFHPGESLEGMARLPGAVRVLFQNAPGYWEAFRQKPRGEQVRTVSRLMTTVLLTVGSAGAGAVKAVTWGEKLSRLSVPLLTLTREGGLVLRWVAVPGRAVAMAGQGLSVTWGIHLAKVSAGAGGNWVPPVGGPGQWVPKNERMSPRSRAFQHKVTKSPAGWVYRVSRNGEKADFDGFEQGILLETKGSGYDKHFKANLEPKDYFTGAGRLVRQAQRQYRAAHGTPIHWHVAEPRMVDILKKLFKANDVVGIDVIYTPPSL